VRVHGGPPVNRWLPCMPSTRYFLAYRWTSMHRTWRPVLQRMCATEDGTYRCRHAGAERTPHDHQSATRWEAACVPAPHVPSLPPDSGEIPVNFGYLTPYGHQGGDPPRPRWNDGGQYRHIHVSRSIPVRRNREMGQRLILVHQRFTPFSVPTFARYQHPPLPLD
jgi:hypothetical protein